MHVDAKAFIGKHALDKLRGEQKEAQRLLEQANYDLTNAETDLRTAEDAALRLQGEEKQHLTKRDLLDKFAEVAGAQVESDEVLLS